MPIHDWTRVEAGIFHHFHTSWMDEIAGALNAGLLPEDYYALAEQVAGALGPDVLTLQTPHSPGNGVARDSSGTLAVATVPPKVQLTVCADSDEYTTRRRTVVIRHVSGHRIVALIEILPPGNKASWYPFRTFLDKAIAALTHGIHLLIVDLFPPGPRDPQGIHGVLWEQLTEGEHTHPLDKPLTLAAYSAGAIPVAYVQPVAIGDALPDMPLFLTPEEYINVPLQATYQAAYARVPRFYRNILEG
jgi:hypothetical protein